MNEHLITQLVAQAEYDAGHDRWLHASQSLLRILNEHPDRIDLSLRLADVYLRMGNLDAAERTMLVALARDPGNVDVLYALGRMFYAGERFDEALRYLEQLLPYHIPQAHFTAALIHYKRGNLPAAERHFRRTIELDADHPRGREMLGRTLIATQRYDAARTILLEAVAQPGEDGTAWTLLGSACALLGRWDESIAAFNKAVLLKPGDASLMGEFAQAMIRGGRLTEGEDMLRRAGEVDANAPHVLLGWGMLMIERADRGRAVEYFDRVLAVDPTNESALQYRSLLTARHQPA